jgi:4-hydroxy-L-threonine phosphate dehydrogenase PdxA
MTSSPTVTHLPVANRRVRLAVTVGDPRGIGPEIINATLETPTIRERCDLVIVGPTNADVQIDHSVGDWSPTGNATEDIALAGRLSGLAIAHAVTLAQQGAVDGIVTAPIDKAALLAGGYEYPGHTEMLSALTGAPVAMMLASEKLRVVLATTHIALRDVPSQLTAEAIHSAAAVTRVGLQQWFGIERPRIALCALNPHAGDHGRFGDEDDRLLAPTARECVESSTP